MEDYKTTHPITEIAICLILSCVGPVFQIKIEQVNWVYFTIFVVCDMTLFWTLGKVVDYIVFSNNKIQKCKLSMYETMEKAEPYFSQIENAITQERNRTIFQEIATLLLRDIQSGTVYTVDMVKKCFENQTISAVVEKSLIPRKYKRLCYLYIKKYNNNTLDFDELKIDYKTQKMLQNEVDIKSILGLSAGLITGLVGMVSLTIFVDFLYAKIINIIIVLIIDAAYSVDRYCKQKAFYLEYYTEKNNIVTNAMELIKQA